MIVRFFRTGTSNGEAPVRYLLSTTDHEGNPRPHAPEILEGTPALTVDIINSISRKHKYASGCLAFRPDEKPTREELLGILDSFKEVVAPGLSPDQFNALFVLHQELPDRKTGQAGFHVHFVLPMTILGGANNAGKDLAGRRWNPHPPGKQTIEVMSLFTQITNHEHDWKQVQERAQKLGLNSLWLKAPHYTQKQKAQLLHKEVLNAINTGDVKNKLELIGFMEDKLGLTVTRANDKTVSVKFPGDTKAVRLKGDIYETGTNLQHLATQGSSVLTLGQYTQAKERLTVLLTARAEHTTNTTTKRRRDVYGQRRNEISTAGATTANRRTGRTSWGENNFSLRESRLERNLLSQSGGQWRHSHGQSHQADGQRVGHVDHQIQPFERIRESASWGTTTGRGGPRGGRKSITTSSTATNFAATLEEQIRTLSIELDDCQLGSLEARTITDEINRLVGERGRLAPPNASKSKFK